MSLAFAGSGVLGFDSRVSDLEAGSGLLRLGGADRVVADGVEAGFSIGVGAGFDDSLASTGSDFPNGSPSAPATLPQCDLVGGFGSADFCVGVLRLGGGPFDSA